MSTPDYLLSFLICIVIRARNFAPHIKRHINRDAMISARQLGQRSRQFGSFNLGRCCSAVSSLSAQPHGLLRQSPSLSPTCLVHRRNAGTKLRKSIEELPQGLQAPLEPFIEKEASKYSPVIDEVLQNQRRFSKCVLLTRVGQFYEVFRPSLLADNSYTSHRQKRSRRY